MRAVLSVAAVLSLAGIASAQVYIPFGTASGSLAVQYNTPAPEIPTNQHYYRAQNSPTNTNGATFNFDNTFDLSPAPGVQSMYTIFQAVPNQFGFDLVLPAPTTTGGAMPVITARDNVNGNVASAAPAGPIAWGISGYTGPTDGPANAANSIINSLFRSNNADPATLAFSPPVPIVGGFQVAVSGFLNADGLIYWYNPSFPNSNMATFFNDGTLYASGRIKFDGVLTYLVATDTTPGTDYYNGSMNFQLEMIPAPGAAALLGLGGLAAARRRRR